MTTTGCQSTQPDRSVGEPAGTPRTAEVLLANAARAEPRRAASLRLEAVTALVDNGDLERAYATLSSIDVAQLDDRQRFRFDNTSARVALDLGRVDEAWSWIAAARPTDPQMTRQRDLTMADVASARRDYVTAAQALMRVSAVSAPAFEPDAQQLSDAIWADLQHVPSITVAGLAGTSTDSIAAPWWQLGAAMDRAFDVSAQRQLVTAWLAEHPRHPAAAHLPGSVAALLRPTASPTHVGLLLPFTGPLAPAGEAIRDGYLAAYYHAGSNTRVTLYDSHADSVEALYEQAFADGVELIVGPLDRSRVSALHAISHRQLPVLALNYLPRAVADPAPQSPETDGTEESRVPGDFLQLGLAIEDEARAIARRAAADGAQQVVLLVSDADWSERAASEFFTRWDPAGESQLETAYVTSVKSLTEVVGNAMHVDASSRRMEEIAGIIEQPIEFMPRRRQDIDAVVALVNAVQGGAVMPALAYHFAADVPVYATSQVTAAREPGQLNELNGMRICQIPWTIYPSPIRHELRQAFADQAPPGPLHALGVDAYRLSDRLHYFVGDPNARLVGATGILTNTDTGLDRELVWSVVLNGRLEPMPTVIN